MSTTAPIRLQAQRILDPRITLKITLRYTICWAAALLVSYLIITFYDTPSEALNYLTFYTLFGIPGGCYRYIRIDHNKSVVTQLTETLSAPLPTPHPELKPIQLRHRKNITAYYIIGALITLVSTILLHLYYTFYSKQQSIGVLLFYSTLTLNITLTYIFWHLYFQPPILTLSAKGLHNRNLFVRRIVPIQNIHHLAITTKFNQHGDCLNCVLHLFNADGKEILRDAKGNPCTVSEVRLSDAPAADADLFLDQLRTLFTHSEITTTPAKT